MTSICLSRSIETYLKNNISLIIELEYKLYIRFTYHTRCAIIFLSVAKFTFGKRCNNNLNFFSLSLRFSTSILNEKTNSLLRHFYLFH